MHKMIRRRAAAAGYDESLVAALGGHSLRAGFVTQAFRNGADALAICGRPARRPGDARGVCPRVRPLIGNAVTQIGL